jgi:putative hydrolase of the HAD superfamily
MKALFVFDADNTLWDTDAVFRDAQLSLLRVLEDAGILDDADLEFPTLRMLDRELFAKLGRFEYDFQLLASVAVHYFSAQPEIDKALEMAYAPISPNQGGMHEVANKAYKAFDENLKQIPPLFNQSKEVLEQVRSITSTTNSVAMLLLSEGERGRLEKILKMHHMQNGFFDKIIIEPTKNKEIFAKAKSIGEQLLFHDQGESFSFVVGDSLKRDIRFGNQCGFTTIYKPAGFMGVEASAETDDIPTHVIKSLIQLPILLTSIGLPINKLSSRIH